MKISLNTIRESSFQKPATISPRQIAEQSTSSTISSCTLLTPFKAIQNFFTWLFRSIFCCSSPKELTEREKFDAKVKEILDQKPWIQKLPRLYQFLVKDPTFTYDADKDYDLGYEDILGVAFLDPRTTGLYSDKDREFIEYARRRYPKEIEETGAINPDEEPSRFADSNIYGLFNQAAGHPELDIQGLLRDVLIYFRTGLIPPE